MLIQLIVLRLEISSPGSTASSEILRPLVTTLLHSVTLDESNLQDMLIQHNPEMLHLSPDHYFEVRTRAAPFVARYQVVVPDLLAPTPPISHLAAVVPL